MKNFKRLIAVTMVLMMLVSAICVVNVSAAGGRKLLVSHINQEDVFSNASVIFTKKFMDDNGYVTLGDVTAGYKSKMGDKVAAIDPEWNSHHTDHKFGQYYSLVCQWNEDNARYEVIEAGSTKACPNMVCPENGFILAIHCDRDINGQEPHNYPSTKFAEQNLGQPGTANYVTATYWKSLVNQPIYLYNIDIEAATVQTTGTFDSKMSEAGLANGMVEVYENFSSDSYVFVCEEDPDNANFYEPKNITVSFTKIDKLISAYEDLDFLDYNSSSWANLESTINKYSDDDRATLDNKAVKAWVTEVEEAMAALIPAGEGEDDGPADSGEEDDGGIINPGKTDGETEGGFNILFVVIPVAAVLVIGGVIFLVLASKKNKK